MKLPTFDDLVLLHESEALQRYFASRNWRILRGVLAIALLISLVGLVSSLEQGKPLAFILYLADAAVTVALFGSRKEPWFERNYQRFQTAYLLLQDFAWSPGTFGVHKGVEISGVLPWLCLFLRLSPADAVLIYGGYWAVSCLPLATL